MSLKHDDLVNIVESEMTRRGYTQTLRGYEYDYVPRGLGEIDYLAFKNHYALIFEVKQTHGAKQYKKALSQLNRSTQYLESLGFRVFPFYVTQRNGGISYKWLKNIKR